MSIISINGNLYEVPDNDLSFYLKEIEGGKPEVEYIKLSSGIYVPTNIINSTVLERLLELDKELERIKQRIRHIEQFDVFVKEKGMYAKIKREKDIKIEPKYLAIPVGRTGKGIAYAYIPNPEKKNRDGVMHYVEKYVYEDGEEEVKIEWEADFVYKVKEYDGWLFPDREREPEPIRDTMRIIKQANYTEIPIENELKELKKRRDEIIEEEKKMVLEELRKLGFSFKVLRETKWNEVEVEIEYNDEKSYAVLTYDHYIGYRGKYSLIGTIFLI